MKKKEKKRYAGALPLGVMPYVAMVCIAMMYTLCRQYVVICSVIMITLCCGIYYIIYHLAEKYRVSATPLGASVLPVVLVAMGCGIVFVVGMSSGSDVSFADEGSFVHFLFTASLVFNPLHAAAAIALFSLIIGFVCCYFSAILPRPGLLMFPTLIPIILSSVGGGLPMWMIILMFGLLVVAIICSAVPCETSDIVEFSAERRGWQRTAKSAGSAIDFRSSGNGWQRIVSAVVVAVLVVGACSYAPKDDEALLKDMVEQFSGITTGFSHGGTQLTNFNANSSVNRGANNLPDNLLFTVQTDTPVCVDRWTFDVYNGSKGWSTLDIYNTGAGEWEDIFSLHRMPELISQLKAGAENGKLEGYADVLAAIPEAASRNGLMYISVMDGSSTKVVLHPVGTYGVNMKDYAGHLYRVPKGEIFTKYDIKDAQYLIRFAAEQPDALCVNAMKDVDFIQLLLDAELEDVIDGDISLAFQLEYEHAQDYKKHTGLDGISPDIIELAQEITADCEDDYQKAVALTEWFGEQEFIYDLNFRPSELTADHFLFQSKTGICSDYASALTLMARAAGLPARYVEGFALPQDIRDENGVYNVTGSEAHAYTQIYIKGFGWANFDATKYAIPAENLPPVWLVPLLIVLGCILLLALLAFIFRKPLSYLLLTAAYPLMKERDRVRRVSLKARELACDISGRKQESMTMGEMEEILSNTLSLPAEAAEIRTAADKLLYNDSTDGCDTKRLLSCLKVLRRQKRRLKK